MLRSGSNGKIKPGIFHLAIIVIRDPLKVIIVLKLCGCGEETSCSSDLSYTKHITANFNGPSDEKFLKCLSLK